MMHRDGSRQNEQLKVFGEVMGSVYLTGWNLQGNFLFEQMISLYICQGGFFPPLLLQHAYCFQRENSDMNKSGRKTQACYIYSLI